MKFVRGVLSLFVFSFFVLGSGLVWAEKPTPSGGEENWNPSDSPYVLVLGTAQDGGLPQIGTTSKLSKWAAENPEHKRLVSSLLIVHPPSGQRWLIDATPDLRQQVERAEGHPPTRKKESRRPPLFEGIFLTHAHMGHYTGLIHLGREAYGSREMPVYGSEKMEAFLRDNGPWNLLVNAGHIVLRRMTPDQPVELAPGLSITPILVPHRGEYTDTFGFMIRGPEKSLLYIPDIDKWEKWERRIEDVIAQVDVALLDGTFYADGEIPGRAMSEIPHPFIEESLQRFLPLSAEMRSRIVFTHLNHTNEVCDPQGEAAAVVQKAGMSIASDGQRFDL